MTFQSARFFALLFLTLLAYRAVPARLKNTVLLAASVCFYMAAGIRHLPLLLVAALLSFVTGLVLGRCERLRTRRAILTAALLALFGQLCLFKYGGALGIQLSPPLGVSFYTFALSGYLIDQYRRKYAPEKNFVRFAVFACFFPLVSSGPIERGDGLLAQLCAPPKVTYEGFCEGASRMLWGFFRKFVVADTIGTMVDRVFSDLPAFAGPCLLLAVLLYSYELYCDFAGYSDIAIGAARMFGFTVRENFARPFAARSFSELWRRWHMSLTGWLREYLYFPLGGSRKGKPRTFLNILIIFLVSGVWHGAGWTFALWGLLNGVYMVVGRATQEWPLRRAARNALARHKTFYAFLQIVFVYLLFTSCIVFFRAPAMADAVYVYTHLFTGWQMLLRPSEVIAALRSMNIGRVTGLLTLGGALLAELVEWAAARGRLSAGAWMRTLRTLPRVTLYYALALLVMVFGALGSSSFIYFAF